MRSPRRRRLFLTTCRLRIVAVPFRAHRLTTLLKDCFTNPEHSTCVIATASPIPTDIEHTRRTLEHVCAIVRGFRFLLAKIIMLLGPTLGTLR